MQKIVTLINLLPNRGEKDMKNLKELSLIKHEK